MKNKEYLEKEMQKGKLSASQMKEEISKIDKILTEQGIPDDLKISLKERKMIFEVMLLNTWFPRGVGRRFIMLLVFLIGLFGVIIDNLILSLFLLLVLFFSPKIVIKSAMIIGFLKGNR